MDDRAFHAGQGFLLSAKTWWTTSLYQSLRDELEASSVDTHEAGVSEVAEVLEDSPAYQYFAWFERHLQRMKYSGRYGLVPYFDERRVETAHTLEKQGSDAIVDPDFKLPRYYTSTDIHQHPGGVWSDDTAGFVYEHGARSTTPLLGGAHKDLHDRFTDEALGTTSPMRLLDMGCGFGKSTGPFAELGPDTWVEAVDLSAPCVKLAARRAAEKGQANVTFRQMDARRTNYPDASFDFVTSSMVIHELPPRGIIEFFAECMRLLEPGGRMAHLDFYALPDAFRRFLLYGHGRRNNEPFMQALAKMDLRAELARLGFEDIEISPFREDESVDLEANDAWRFPWTVIKATKPSGTAG
jgi:ubiquinone/menaquinone biosynthesis C-methylase UbiE